MIAHFPLENEDLAGAFPASSSRGRWLSSSARPPIASLAWVVVSTVAQILWQTWTQHSRRPDSVRPSQRSRHIPGGYRIRSSPRGHVGWSVSPQDQR